MVLRQLTTYFPSDIGTTFSGTTITLSGAALIPGVPAIPVVPPFRSFRHFCRPCHSGLPIVTVGPVHFNIIYMLLVLRTVCSTLPFVQTIILKFCNFLDKMAVPRGLFVTALQ